MAQMLVEELTDTQEERKMAKIEYRVENGKIYVVIGPPEAYTKAEVICDVGTFLEVWEYQKTEGWLLE